MKYIMLTFKHKWFVFLAGLRLKVSLWRLITHDLSKLLPSELPHYQRQFFGDRSDPEGFAACWVKHQNRNEHHWEYWVNRSDKGSPVRMPEQAIREMVADWLGASRAYEGRWPVMGDWPWLAENFHKTNLHNDTCRKVVDLLEGLRDSE